MSQILIAIHPRFVDQILSHEKRYEFRRVKPRKKVTSLLIYETKPIMKVVAQVEVIRVLDDEKTRIWQETREFSGLTKVEFDHYYENKTNAVAFCLGDVHKFNPPRDLHDFGIKNSPQAFLYLDL